MFHDFIVLFVGVLVSPKVKTIGFEGSGHPEIMEMRSVGLSHNKIGISLIQIEAECSRKPLSLLS